MSQIAILPCPFCGHHDVEICEVEPGRIAIDCPECECIGPFADSVEQAAELWNAPHLTLRQVLRHDALMTEQVLDREKMIEKLLADKYALMRTHEQSQGAGGSHVATG